MKDQKPAVWMGSSKDDLRDFPIDVRRVMGVAINDAQNGEEHPDVKALKGFGGRSLLEVVDDYDGDTYRGSTLSDLLARSMSFTASRRSQGGGAKRPSAILR